MREGVVLRADVFRPEGAERRPAILIRTPYGKQKGGDDKFAALAAGRGYAVVIQDVRGRYASGGEFDPYRQEGRDGYDTVEWIASQPWSNGRVGTAGLSYPGAVQWLLAVEAPPHLQCMFPAMCFSSARQFIYFGGAFDLSWIPWTANNIAPDERRRHRLRGSQTVAEARAAWPGLARETYRRLPLNTLPLPKDVAPFYFEWLDHPDDSSYWDYADIRSKYAQVKVPSFNFSGWHDEGYGPVGATTNFLGMRHHAATASARAPRLLIGPWTHGEPTLKSTRVGDRDFGAAAGLDYYSLVLDWCDLHLRGIDRGLTKEAPVRYFVMGENRWRESQEWPVPGTIYRELYLRAVGNLSWEPPGANEAADRYVYDPNHPLEDPHFDAGLGPHDQHLIETRSDIKVFTTVPLSEDLEVTGHIEFRLWVSSTATDTDFFARLLDVEPDGTAWNLMSPTLEVLRTRYRHREDQPELMVPDRVYELSLRLGMTSNLFRRGHRIRVQITSSFFPHLDRNPNTGSRVAAESKLLPASQTIFHDALRPSKVILPIIPR